MNARVISMACLVSEASSLESSEMRLLISQGDEALCNFCYFKYSIKQSRCHEFLLLKGLSNINMQSQFLGHGSIIHFPARKINSQKQISTNPSLASSSHREGRPWVEHPLIKKYWPSENLSKCEF